MNIKDNDLKKVESIDLERFQKPLIYFLADGNEIVYVGKTTLGLERPLSHKEKDYDIIHLLYCGISELDDLETFYINKYKPKYNKKPGELAIPVTKVKKYLKQKLNITRITRESLKGVLFAHGIRIKEIKGKEYIYLYEYNKLKEIY